MAKRRARKGSRKEPEVINPADVVLTTDADGLFEHIRRCDDCIDAVLDWAKPQIQAMGKPGGHLRTNWEEFKRQARLQHDLVDEYARLYVVVLQESGQLSSHLDHVAKIMRQRREPLKKRALGKDHPMVRAMRRADPRVVDILVDDPYCYVLTGKKRRTATRYAMSPEMRAALEAEARGEAIPVGSYELNAPSLTLDAQPET